MTGVQTCALPILAFSSKWSRNKTDNGSNDSDPNKWEDNSDIVLIALSTDSNVFSSLSLLWFATESTFLQHDACWKQPFPVLFYVLLDILLFLSCNEERHVSCVNEFLLHKLVFIVKSSRWMGFLFDATGSLGPHLWSKIGSCLSPHCNVSQDKKFWWSFNTSLLILKNSSRLCKNSGRVLQVFFNNFHCEEIDNYLRMSEFLYLLPGSVRPRTYPLNRNNRNSMD